MKCGDDADNAKHRRDAQNRAHVPRFGLLPVDDVAIGDRQDGAVVEQRQHDDHDRGQGIEFEDDDRQRHEQENAQPLGDPRHAIPLDGTYVGFQSDHLGMEVQVSVMSDSPRGSGRLPNRPHLDDWANRRDRRREKDRERGSKP